MALAGDTLLSSSNRLTGLPHGSRLEVNPMEDTKLSQEDESFITQLRALKRQLDRTYNTCDRGVIQARINLLIEQRDREI